MQCVTVIQHHLPKGPILRSGTVWHDAPKRMQKQSSFYDMFTFEVPMAGIREGVGLFNDAQLSDLRNQHET